MKTKQYIFYLMAIFILIPSWLLFSQTAGDIRYDPIVGAMRLVPITAGTDGAGIPHEIPRLGEEQKDYENNSPLQFIPSQAKNLWVMETEVSQQMWNDLMVLHPTLPVIDFAFKGAANPVENITWYDAVLFANLLSLQNGLTRCYYADAGFTVPIDAYNYTTGSVYCNFNADGYRLPTESEWQYLARAGDIASLSMEDTTADPGNYYTCEPGDLPILEDTAWYCANSEGATHPVGSRLPNALNLMDLQGNVSEWCWDWWGIYPGGIRVDYKGPVSGVSRVVRGGSWYDPPALLDPDSRSAVNPGLGFSTLGFRLLKPLSGFAVTSPQGGEYWKQGTTHDITWTQGEMTGDVTIELYKGGVFDSTISSTVPAIDETFSWDIPTDQATGVDYKVKIYQDATEAFSAANFTIYDSSDFLVSFVAGTGGTVTGEKNQVVSSGGDCTEVTAEPDSCYRFVNWTGTGGFVPTTENPLTVTNVTTDMTITANFEIIHYTVTFEAGPNGTVTGDTPQEAECGGHCTEVTAIPDSCYRFINWTGTGGFLPTDVNPLTVNNVQSGMTITANFEKIQYSVIFTVGTGGTVTGDSPQEVDCGDSCTEMTAVPNSCYRFVNWTGTNGFVTTSENPLTVTNVESDMTITANFEKIPYTVTFEAGTGGTVTGDTPQEVECGGDCTEVTAVPASCYRFVNWTGTGGFVPTTDNPLIVTTVQSDMTITANFEKIPYTVTFGGGTGGTVTGDTPQEVECGGNCTAVTAVPASCYRFVNWTGTGGFVPTTDNPLIVTTVQSDMTITANFEKIPYTVTFEGGTGGTVTGDTPQPVECGDNCSTVAAYESAGYHFVNWTGTGGFVTTTENPLTVTNVTSNMDITANFAINTYIVSFQADTGGASNGRDGGTITGVTTQFVNHDGDCSEVVAIAGSGYAFVNWTGPNNFVSNDTHLAVTKVTKDMAFIAHFSTNSLTVTFQPGTGGTVTGDVNQFVNYGGDCTDVAAVPNANYHFANWTGTGGFTSTENPLTVRNVTANMTITANFSNTHTVIFKAKPGGTLSGTTIQTINHGGDCSAVTAIPNTGYSFVNWTGSGGFVSTDKPVTVTNVTTDMEIMANFTINNYTVTFEPGANGTLTGSTSQVINYGSDCTAVTAVPNTNYHFVNWTGSNGFVSTNNPLIVGNVTSNMTITANFAINTYTVTFVAGSNGTLTGNTTQTVNHGGNCTAVTAVPNTGYHFVNWTKDGSSYSETNPLTVTNVTGNMTITANFSINTYTVVFAAGANGIVTGNLSQTINYGSSCTTVTAVPNTGYNLSNWTGTNGFVTTSANPLTVTNVSANMTITANFTNKTYMVKFIVPVDALGGRTGGAINGFTTQIIIHGQNCSAVTAVSGGNYHFVNWTGTGDFVSTNNPLTVTNVTSDMTINANFVLNPYTLIFQAGTGGTLTGQTIQYVEYGGSSTAVTAVENSGYHFMNWTDVGGFMSNNKTLTITNVTGNMTIRANFLSNTPVVSIIYPLAGSTVSGTVNVQARTAEDLTVTKVEFYIDNVLKGTVWAYPFCYSWNTKTATNASHQIKAKAYYGGGLTEVSPIVTVTVKN